jgi:hypothetical protein
MVCNGANCSGITFGLRRKIRATLNPELPFETEAAFPQNFQ